MIVIGAVPTRLVAFDLDDTLAPSKAVVPHEVVEALLDLLDKVPVCVISGGQFDQFESQFLQYLDPTRALSRLHIMPTCGTQYYRWSGSRWELQYSKDLDANLRRRAMDVLEEEAKRLGLWEPDAAVFGSRIEDRSTQITFSALGQEAPVELKMAWDPSGARRDRLRDAVEARLPELEVRKGGSTSIDITDKGIDKAFGIGRLSTLLGIQLDEIHFVGDRLQPGGNDYPVLELGVPTHSVLNWVDGLSYIRHLLTLPSL